MPNEQRRKTLAGATPTTDHLGSIYLSGAHLTSEIIVLITMTTLIIMMNNDNTYTRGSTGIKELSYAPSVFTFDLL